MLQDLNDCPVAEGEERVWFAGQPEFCAGTTVPTARNPGITEDLRRFVHTRRGICGAGSAHAVISRCDETKNRGFPRTPVFSWQYNQFDEFFQRLIHKKKQQQAQAAHGKLSIARDQPDAIFFDKSTEQAGMSVFSIKKLNQELWGYTCSFCTRS